jgi:hypothetical protein
MFKMVELETVKQIRVSGQTRKLLRRIISTKTKKVGFVFIVERKAITSENANS